MARRERRGRGAPRGEASEWIGGRVSPPWFIEDRVEPYRPEIVLWLERPSGLIVGQELFAPEDAAGALGRVLRRALGTPLAGAARRPDKIRVADAALAAEVRAELGNTIPVAVAPTPELAALLADMVDSISGPGEDASYLEGGRIPPEALARLFAAAELLFVTAPWKVATDGQVLRMDIPALGVEGACVSIIGNLGESLGVLVFPSLAGYEAFGRAAEEPRPERWPFDLGTDWLALDFERGADLPASLRCEVAAHGWPVASADAYPQVTRHDRDGVARPLVERDVRIAAACAKSLTAFFVKHRRVFEVEEFEPVCESWFDEDDLEVRFTLPYEAFPRFEVESPAATKSAAGSGALKPSRNAPCPCGSGRKYKKCCLLRDEPRAGGRHPFQELDDRLARALTDFAAQRFGSAWLRAEEFASQNPSILQIAVPWSLYHHRSEGQSVLEGYLEERHRRLSTAERACLEAQRAAWLSVWEVTDVEPGASVTLRDLLSGEARQVHERTASRSLVRRDALLARVVDGDGVSLICGMHPGALAPSAAADVVRRARVELRRKGPVPVGRLREESFGRYLIRRWEEAVAERDARRGRPKQLVNTDGDPFLITTDHFEIAPEGKPAVEAALAALPGVEPPEPGEHPPSWVFVRPGNRMHESWDNTIVGRAWISGQALHAETNSRERADALRAQLEAACGEQIRHRAREHGDPLSERASKTRLEKAAGPPPPEAEQLVLELKQRHYAGWPDQPLPALRGQTPRQAIRSAAGRAAVDVLLKEIEHTEQRMPSGERFDVSALRRELRLDGGGES